MTSTIFKKFHLPANMEIKGIDWKTQDSRAESLLFYSFSKKNEDEFQLFNQRLENCQYRICITNCYEDHKRNIYKLENDDYENFQNEILEKLYPINKNKKYIGVTGTNGKTTTVDILRQLLILNKKQVLSIGTLGVYLNNNKMKDFSLTTPSKIDLQKVLHKYRDDYEFVVMEISSHALSQNRLSNIKLDRAGWTNFTQDHLDYHKTMDNYFCEKLKIKDLLKESTQIYTCEDQVEIIEKLKNKIKICESVTPPKLDFFKINYNVKNLALAWNLIKDFVEIDRNIFEKLVPPDGRFGTYKYRDSLIVIDFAHTPDALESILSEIKKSFSNQKIKTLFGCGGNRDKGKRKLMGEVASRYSSTVYLTSDNPRLEDPQEIINDIKTGIDNNFYENVDRKETIKYAISQLKNEILLIAGKGHEQYIDIGGKKIDYSDHQVVQELISDKC